MKIIPLREAAGIKTADIIKAVMEHPGQGGIDVKALRARCRVLDALDAAADGAVHLEDADYATLSAAIAGFRFGVASRDLLAIVDDILKAGD